MAVASSPFSFGPSPFLSSPSVSYSSSVPFSVFFLSGRLRKLHLCRSFGARPMLCEDGGREDRFSGGTAKKTQKSGPDFCEETSRWSFRVPSRRTRFPWQEKGTELAGEQPQEPSGRVRSPRRTSEAGRGRSPDAARHVRRHQMDRAVANSSPRISDSRDASPSSRRKPYKREIMDSKTDSLAPEVPILRSKKSGGDDYPDFLSLLSGRRQLPAPSFHVDDEDTSRLEDLEKENKAEKSMISSILETLNTSRNEEEDSELNSYLDGDESDSVSLSRDFANGDGKRLSWNRNTLLAEKTIPEPELRRLRNLSLKMKERTKVGPSGVNEELVDTIQKKWKEVEVIRLKFEGPPALHMKKTHVTLEKRTGGIVIWRSGSSLVLYRGMTYGLPCIQTYKNSNDSTKISSHSPKDEDDGPIPTSGSCNDHQSSQSNDNFDIERFLDELGPRFRDWSGRNPLPIDADLLPSLVPGYKPPYRLLPYKTKLAVQNGEMTYLRRLARSMPPHFALGRNRMLQGLAQAIVKLWEKSVIAKIAIKRGVPNTSNERMAEEIKNLTGGVLVSRNKEYIVFYRGKDFLMPKMTEVLNERQNLSNARHDEEEHARLRASSFSFLSIKTSELPRIAGTLAETLEAKTRWDNQLDSVERERVAQELVLEKQASEIRFLEKKLNIAREKVNKAEKALYKVHEFLSPAKLPTDLETVTDEERSLYRKIGLKMKSFLSMGRREVFDGTVENMHLNWKHRELVKIIVKGRSFGQVKHIAISLEAESGGILISLDKTTKGYAIIVYRGKNYQRPQVLRPKNLLTRRQALARSIELQRREALKFHISTLRERIELLKADLEQMKVNGQGHPDGHPLPDHLYSSDDDVEDEGEEAYLQTYASDDDDDLDE